MYYFKLFLITTYVFLSHCGALQIYSEDLVLGQWKLESDADDSAQNQNNGISHGVKYRTIESRQAALFDGRDDYIQIDSPEFKKIGTHNFTISVWVHTAEKLDDNLGTIISQYDSAKRTGFQLSIKNHAGVTSSQSNYRHLQFGIDQARQSSKWINHGRLGEAILIYSMAVFNNQLFVGTCVSGKQAAGHLYRFDGKNWFDCGSPDKSNAITSLAVYQNQLFIATGKYRLAGSSLQESQNNHLGGNVFRYEADQKFINCGSLPNVEAVNGMVVYQDNLYASSMYAPAGFFRYEGGSKWTSCGTPDDKRVESLTVYNGFLYASGYDQGAVYRYDGKTWTHSGQVGQATQTYGFATYQGSLYVSEWPNAEVFRFGGGMNWIRAGKLGEEKETMPLVVYNGKMYGGTLPLAEVYRYDGQTNWNKVGRLDFTPDVRYRRVWSMAVYQGRLFAGTLPAGHVQSWEAGKNVTYDTALPSGWVHISAVRDTNKLLLFLNGKQVAVSSTFDTKNFDLSTSQPLKVGTGAHDYFNGGMRDLRIYKRALNKSEIRTLFQAR